MRADVFGPLETRFVDRVSSFQEFFQITSAFTGEKGTAPALWDADFGTETPVTADAFTGHSLDSLTNWEDIPTTWGGPKE